MFVRNTPVCVKRNPPGFVLPKCAFCEFRHQNAQSGHLKGVSVKKSMFTKNSFLKMQDLEHIPAFYRKPLALAFPFSIVKFLPGRKCIKMTNRCIKAEKYAGMLLY